MAEKTIKSSGNKLIISGFFLILISAVWRYHQIRILSFSEKALEEITKTSEIKPVYIKSYPIGIDVEVKDAAIVKGVWTIYPDVASYLVTSAGIGDENNIIIYGHNKNKIMGPIRFIKKDAEIEITGSDGNKYFYKVVSTEMIRPDDLTYIKPTPEETLTIYTCAGFLDSMRFVAVAKPISK